MAEPTNVDIMVHLARIEEQNKQLTQLMINNHAAINQRLDDMKANTNTRLDSLDKRLVSLEDKERGTAIKSAGTGAISGAIAAAAMAALKHVVGG